MDVVLPLEWVLFNTLTGERRRARIKYNLNSRLKHRRELPSTRATRMFASIEGLKARGNNPVSATPSFPCYTLIGI